MAKILRTYYIFFVILLIASSLLLEYDLIPTQNLHLKSMKIPKKNRRDHSFTFVIPSHNCADITKKTLDSIFAQSYQNFRIIYIDDGSSDLTYSIAVDYAEEIADPRLEIKRNPTRKGALESLYEVSIHIPNDEIIVYLKGNAWLDQKSALEKLHRFYRDYDVWMATSRHKNYKTGEVGGKSGWCLHQNALRRKSWDRSKLKSFYAGLFKRVKIKDFFFEGMFVSDAIDSAYMFPLLEMAANHTAYIKEPLCSFIERDLIDEKRPSSLFPKTCMQKIRADSPYKALHYHPATQDKLSLPTIDLCIVSEDSPIQLYSLLESIERYAAGYTSMQVLYSATNERYSQAYDEVIERFSMPQFIHVTTKTLFYALQHSVENQEGHILIIQDSALFKDHVNLTDCALALERSKASFFSLVLGKNIAYLENNEYEKSVPNSISLSKNMICWQPGPSKRDWFGTRNLSMVLCKKELIASSLEKSHPKSMVDFLHLLKGKKSIKDSVGIAFTESKAIILPLKSPTDYTKETLLAEFEKGKKINIDSASLLSNTRVKVDYDPSFTPRRKQIATLE